MDILHNSAALFAKISNCPVDGETDYCDIGITRWGEVRTFVDAFMAEWVHQFPAVSVLNDLPLAQQLHIYAQRLCTYQEYEQLFTSPKNNLFHDPVFRLLAIDDEQKRRQHARTLTKDMDGYFRLMEALNARLATFFFPAQAIEAARS